MNGEQVQNLVTMESARDRHTRRVEAKPLAEKQIIKFWTKNASLKWLYNVEIMVWRRESAAGGSAHGAEERETRGVSFSKEENRFCVRFFRTAARRLLVLGLQG